MSMNKISIIIPHYNDWSNLKELLSTIPFDKTFEVIVVDDNTPNSEGLLRTLKEEYPSVLFLVNTSGTKGAGASRNIGLEHATGSWLLFADADDMFSDNFKEVINEYTNSNYDIIYFSPHSFIEDTKETSSRHSLYKNLVLNYKYDKTLLYELKLRYEFVVPWSKLVRHQLVENNNIKFEEIMYANDILFSAKVGYYAADIYPSSQNIYNVRENEGSLTNIISEERFFVRLNSWVQYNKFLQRKLTKKELHLLNMTGTQQIKYVISNKLGLKNCLYVIKTCRKHGIPIIDKRLFDPRLMLEFLKKRLK